MSAPFPHRCAAPSSAPARIAQQARRGGRARYPRAELVAVTDQRAREGRRRSPRRYGGTRPSTTISTNCSRPSTPTSCSSALPRRASRADASPRSPPARTSSSRSRRRRRSTSSTTMRAAARSGRPPARRRLPAAHRHGRRARPPPAAVGRARPTAARAVPDPVVPRCRLLRRPVARQVGDRGRRHDAGPRHPSARPARVPARRLGERRRGGCGASIARPQTEDASTATVTFENGVVAQVVSSTVSPRETSSIRIDTQKATITVDHLYGHGHENWSITPAPRARRRRPRRGRCPTSRSAATTGRCCATCSTRCSPASRCRRPPTRRRARSRSSRRSTRRPPPTAPSSRPPTSPRTRRIAAASRVR